MDSEDHIGAANRKDMEVRGKGMVLYLKGGGGT